MTVNSSSSYVNLSPTSTIIVLTLPGSSVILIAAVIFVYWGVKVVSRRIRLLTLLDGDTALSTEVMLFELACHLQHPVGGTVWPVDSTLGCSSTRRVTGLGAPTNVVHGIIDAKKFWR